MEAAKAMPKLWELGDELEQVGLAIIENEGELTPELEARLDALAGAWEDKVERVALFVRAQIAMGLAADVECARLERIKKSHERTAATLKAYLQREMERLDRPKVETARVRVRLQANGGTPAIRWPCDPKSLPAELQKVTVAVDAEAVRKAAEDGDLPDGFVFEPRGRHLRID